MIWMKSEKAFIEIKDKLLCFYKSNDKVYLARYKDYLVECEKVIIEECKQLNNVILGKDEKITVIFTNNKNELAMYIIFEEEVERNLVLTKFIQEAKYMEVASINNCLNIFYINETNNISTLSFRILNNKLSLTPAVVIDSIDSKEEVPYKINASNGQLIVCYLRSGTPNIIGYRRFDFSKNSWSNFLVLDNCYGIIKEYNFAALGKRVAYSYIYYKQRKATLCFGIGEESKINKGTLQEKEGFALFSYIELSKENYMKINYLLGNVIKVKEIDGNAELRGSEEIEINNVTTVNKYNYYSDQNTSINEILVLGTDDGEIILDRNYIKSLSIKKYQQSLGINKYLEGDIIFTEMQIDTEIEDENDDSEITIDKSVFKELKLKIKSYEEMLKRVSENILTGEDEKKKLLANIDYLSEQINKKNYTISAFEKAFAERQGMLIANERKINELSEDLRNNQMKANSIEINKLKEIINTTELRNTNNINELKALNARIEESNLLVENKNEELKNLYNSYESLQSQSNLKISQLKELINLNNIEKSNYIIEIKELKKINSELMESIAEGNLEKNQLVSEVRTLSQRIQEQNLMLLDNSNQMNLLQNQILVMEEKNKESFIKKIFKNGE